ncbi:MAG: hypothetical protein JSS65_12855 [Armatimonadetes bacterium]|nr:hypothetical protein [Armatimonadota bacterium]
MLRPAALFACLAACVACHAKGTPPTVLIAQLLAPPVSGVDRNLIMDTQMASALDEVGQVFPVVWSMSDAYIRAANDEKSIAFNPDATEKEIRAAADKLRIPYVLFITVFKEEGNIRPLAYLYRGREGRPIWKFGEYDRQSKYRPRLFTDDKTQDNIKKFGDIDKVFESIVAYTNGVPDWENTALSLARTWSEYLADTTFRGLPKRPRLSAPEKGPGTLGGTDPVVPAPKQGDELKAQTDALVAQGKAPLAIVTLRDAIDKAPYEPKRRIWLTDLLLKQGMPQEAATEARRAASMMPDEVALWLRAAKAWIIAGHPKEAQKDLDQAMQRDGKAVAGMAVLGDIYLMQNRLTDAVEAYSTAIASSPTPEAVVGRAVARGLMGDADGCRTDLHSLEVADPASLDNVYCRAAELIDQAATLATNACRELIPYARHAPKTPESVARAVALQRQTLALSNLVSLLPVPSRFEKSHSERDLAHKLLAQCGQEILDFANSGDDNLGEEATLSLGEAARLLPWAQELFLSERKGQ